MKKNPCTCKPKSWIDPARMTHELIHQKTCDSLKPYRKSWDEYFLDIAIQVATRSTCDRKYVGAVIVRDKTILATGYNGSIRGTDHCDNVGHLMEDGHCVRTVHAEQNAIIQAAKNGTSIDDSVIYVTCSPCWICFKMIANSGIHEIIFGEFYRDKKIFETAEKLGIKLTNLLHI